MRLGIFFWQVVESVNLRAFFLSGCGKLWILFVDPLLDRNRILAFLSGRCGVNQRLRYLPILRMARRMPYSASINSLTA